MPRFAGKAGRILLLTALAVPVSAEPIRLMALRAADRMDRARLVFEFTGTPEYRVVRWAEPKRLLVDIADAELGVGVKQPPPSHPFLGKIRTSPGKKRELRLSVDLKRAVAHRAFISPAGNGVRLIVELIDAEAQKTAARPKTAKAVKTPVRRNLKRRKIRVVAIDAGHGGKDTGAIGPGGHLEKDVVLSMARKLKDMIHAEPGMKAVMIRTGDRFLSLRERLAIARKTQADLFVSLHADAYVHGLARGMSVFTLSKRGASSEAARWLARRENAADLVGGVSLRDKDGTLAKVLIDLSQAATSEASARVASAVLRELKKSFPMHHPEVQKAGFAVLKSPDIPSILVETGFITNPEGESRLADPVHQTKISRAIFYGIRRFLSAKTKPN
ncbi:N-acetylmuramoyl-L-alanine amidase [Methylocaldum sp.]|uniref:N-acetylmuramoyl-L-alanine amidase n=1 Tax=Methylocaldum sp. TaxID=1969727 RepID=UPI002D64E302|nr:N-acetylmuramoyl-L-alanine amidase [Methylocaldum sp.]HYE33802.1 N-acetylmuramoyl-L-alanine amidase [Methylocaldum sp.]